MFVASKAFVRPEMAPVWARSLCLYTRIYEVILAYAATYPWIDLSSLIWRLPQRHKVSLFLAQQFIDFINDVGALAAADDYWPAIKKKRPNNECQWWNYDNLTHYRDAWVYIHDLFDCITRRLRKKMSKRAHDWEKHNEYYSDVVRNLRHVRICRCLRTVKYPPQSG